MATLQLAWLQDPFRPECAVCRRPVDRLERRALVLTDQLVLVAHCHGAREVVVLDAEVALLHDVSLGVAFAQSALPGAQRLILPP